MEALKSIISQSAIRDTAKLVVIGGTVETARRASVSAWNSFVDSFFLTAHFGQEDYPYDWIMHWLAKQPSWSQSREFEITTRDSTGRGGVNALCEEEEEVDVDLLDDDDQLVHGKRKRQVAFMPSLNTTHHVFYHGHWLRITRSMRTTEYGPSEELKISVVARNNSILKKLVLQAKREYEADMDDRVNIYLADHRRFGGWRFNGSRQKRPMSSIVLEPGVKDMLLADAQDFLRSEYWYGERGIPFRRGYLLHGVPGSGKTSLIHAMAGELGLDIYVISLSAKGMSDTTLSTLMSRVPPRCIVLLEDLDAAFTRGVSRDAKSTGIPRAGSSSTATTATPAATTEAPDPNTLSLSGLLNSLDGVAAAEGRLLFATTNHIERLDPALSRPGRMDVWVDFKHASKWQAEGIFKNFFPCKPKNSAAEGTKVETKPSPKNAIGKGGKNAIVVPILDEEEIAVLAAQFAAHIPENELSVAGLQGYLLRNKTRPREAVAEVEAWVIKERELKIRLQKEKEEREAKEKLEKEEAEKKAKREAAQQRLRPKKQPRLRPLLQSPRRAVRSSLLRQRRQRLPSRKPRARHHPRKSLMTR
ncbi:hypothetical protein BOTBODRAFT_444023 [Botryobasidium botryosum FD-172 SS1]|uniref:AAA+ ATPase domain-containing protein n=1 Tax=Botryobasidium botryosum (strain FD-172 SS1) TaxID=930990 RepID=A0A067MVG5_BOTB1|nr:hypothetical protein BOTBODRAFT_444023 [Botryobasidium botryosum FD-172 SS1]